MAGARFLSRLKLLSAIVTNTLSEVLTQNVR